MKPLDVDLVIVPVSGGKDSQACLHLAVETYGPNAVLAVHQDTGFDHPITYSHMDWMANYYQVQLIKVKNPKYESVPDLILKTGTILSRHARRCTRELKTDVWQRYLQGVVKGTPQARVLVLLGMRQAESHDRAKRYAGLATDDVFCLRDFLPRCLKPIRDVVVQVPIISWSTPQVFNFLQSRGAAVNPMYNLGFKRVGCFPCVLAGEAELRKVVSDPVGRKHTQDLWHAITIVSAKAGNPPDKFFDADLGAILSETKPKGLKVNDPFGLLDNGQSGGCSWCQI